MIFYHGTKDPKLRKLLVGKKSTREGDQGNIFLTTDYACAFMYAAAPIRSFAYRNGKLYLFERGEGYLKKLYEGHDCYIFTIEVEGAKQVDHPTGKVYVYDKDIELDVGKREYVPDAYEKMLELEAQGKLGVERWEDYTDEQKQNIRKKFIDDYTPYMEDFKNRFPDQYDFFIYFYPELKIDNKKNVSKTKNVLSTNKKY